MAKASQAHTARPASLRSSSSSRAATGSSSSSIPRPPLPSAGSSSSFIPRPPLPSAGGSSSSIPRPPLPSAGSSSSFIARTPLPSAGGSSSIPRPPLPSAGSSSSSIPRPPLPSAGGSRDVPSNNSKGVSMRLDDDLAMLFELPDPADSFSSTLVSFALDDAVTASADFAHTQVTAGETTEMVEVEEEDEEEPLPDQNKLALPELQGGHGLSPRSKRLVSAVLADLAAGLNPTATTLRLRRAAFWGRVRVAILAVTIATVAAIDLILAIALFSHRRGRYHYDGVPPPT